MALCPSSCSNVASRAQEAWGKGSGRSRQSSDQCRVPSQKSTGCRADCSLCFLCLMRFRCLFLDRVSVTLVNSFAIFLPSNSCGVTSNGPVDYRLICGVYQSSCVVRDAGVVVVVVVVVVARRWGQVFWRDWRCVQRGMPEETRSRHESTLEFASERDGLLFFRGRSGPCHARQLANHREACATFAVALTRAVPQDEDSRSTPNTCKRSHMEEKGCLYLEKHKMYMLFMPL